MPLKVYTVTVLQWRHVSVTESFSVSWWRHQMETFSALLTICAGNSPIPVNSPHKGQWRGALMFTLICARTNGWVNNCEAGDLRRYRTHYDVIVMLYRFSWNHLYRITHQPQYVLHEAWSSHKANIKHEQMTIIANVQEAHGNVKYQQFYRDKIW